MFKQLRGLVSRDLAIDLGTANTLVYARGQGIVLNEPSVVAYREEGHRHRVVAVGDGAKGMLGRTPTNIKAIRPLKDGVIADFDVTEEMLKHFINKVHQILKKNSFIRPSPRVLVSVPCRSTPVERRAIRESAQSAGSRDVRLIEEPMAAALGAGLPVDQAVGTLVVDIGGGTTEIAVISLGGVVYADTVRVGGDRFDETIVNYVRRTKGTLIGEAMAERIKLEVGTAYVQAEIKEIEVRGHNVSLGVPRAFKLTNKDIWKPCRGRCRWSFKRSRTPWKAHRRSWPRISPKRAWCSRAAVRCSRIWMCCSRKKRGCRSSLPRIRSPASPVAAAGRWRTSKATPTFCGPTRGGEACRSPGRAFDVRQYLAWFNGVRRRRRPIRGLFVREPRAGYRLLGWAFASCVLLAVDAGTTLLTPVRSALGSVVAPLHFLAATPRNVVTGVVESVRSRAELVSRNAELERELLAMKGAVSRYEAIRNENARLRDLLESGARLRHDRLLAELVGTSVAPIEIVIDKGSLNGVRVGQAVIDSAGLLGQVAETSALTSRVLLITDPTHAVPVRVLRNGVRGIATGAGRGRLAMKDVAVTVDIVEGDQLVTSGLGGRFPRGLSGGHGGVGGTRSDRAVRGNRRRTFCGNGHVASGSSGFRNCADSAERRRRVDRFARRSSARRSTVA